nr:MAG TPA: hypothetical protein [Caudoviricetes sp.]
MFNVATTTPLDKIKKPFNAMPRAIVYNLP